MDTLEEEQHDISVSAEHLITQITNDIQKHDKRTGYKITDDMLAPYMNNEFLKSEPNNQIIKTLLKNNRLLLYLDQYYTTLEYLKGRITECSIDNLSNRNIFELATLENIVKTEIPLSQNIESSKKLQINYTSQISAKLNNSLQAINQDVEQLKNKDLVYIEMHGLEQQNLFIVPPNVIICKIASYNYVLGITFIKQYYQLQMKKVLEEYGNGKIFTQNCCNNNDLINFYFPGQICNDTLLSSTISDNFFDKEVLQLNKYTKFTVNDISFLSEHVTKNRTGVKEIFLQKFICYNNHDINFGNKIIIISSCRPQTLGTPSSYTEFNYRLEKIQTYINNSYCIRSSQPDNDNFLTRLLNIIFPKTEQSDIWERKYIKKNFKQNQLIWDTTPLYSPFYDTFLSTPINPHKQNKIKHRKITISEVINNKAILKLYSHVDIQKMLDKLIDLTYNYFITTKNINLQNIQAIIYIIIYMINEDIYIEEEKILNFMYNNSNSKKFISILLTHFITVISDNNTLDISKFTSSLGDLLNSILLIYIFDKENINYFIMLMNIINTLYNRFPEFIDSKYELNNYGILTSIYANINIIDNNDDLLNVAKLICSIRDKNNNIFFIDKKFLTRPGYDEDMRNKINKMVMYYEFENKLIFIDLSK